MSDAPIERVLVVVAHPDDETLTAGGLLALLARRAHVTVVTATRGERGEVIGEDLQALLADPAALASQRERELAQAVAALGVQRHLFLDSVADRRWVDSGMRWDADAPFVRALPADDAGPEALSVADPEPQVVALLRIVDDVVPDLVIVDEPGGGYGHPDHRRVHEITMAAAGRARTRPRFVAWPVRATSAVRAAQHWLAGLPLATQELSLPAEDGPLPSIVVPDEDVDIEVDIGAEVPALLGAMAAHRSQVQAIDTSVSSDLVAGSFALSNGVRQPILRRAGLRVAPGWGAREELRQALGLDGEPRDGMAFTVTMVVFTAVLGIFVGAAGTLFHRAISPWGLMIAAVAVLAAAVLARSFVGRAGTLAYAGAVVGTVLVLTYVRPGDDILVTNEAIGLVWVLVAFIGSAAGALAPRSWFADR